MSTPNPIRIRRRYSGLPAMAEIHWLELVNGDTVPGKSTPGYSVNEHDHYFETDRKGVTFAWWLKPGYHDAPHPERGRMALFVPWSQVAMVSGTPEPERTQPNPLAEKDEHEW